MRWTRPAPARQDVDIRFLLPDGEEGREGVRWIQCHGNPILFRGRVSLLVDLVDITRVKELEEADAAREKLASLGQVASGIAHEIRNPLSGFNLNVSTLETLCQRAEGLDPEDRGRIAAVVAQAKTASGTTVSPANTRESTGLVPAEVVCSAQTPPPSSLRRMAVSDGPPA